MKFTMQDLIKCFNKAKEYDYTYIGVRIKIKGYSKPEIIINPKSNFDKKLEYYKQNYNEDLTLKNSDNIRITGISYGDDFDNIEYTLMK